MLTKERAVSAEVRKCLVFANLGGGEVRYFFDAMKNKDGSYLGLD